METRVIGRGAVAGLIAGVLGIVFARIWAEPVIAKSIDYESRRTAVLAALNTAAGRPVAPKGRRFSAGPCSPHGRSHHGHHRITNGTQTVLG